jgi:hypothetical protein
MTDIAIPKTNKEDKDEQSTQWKRIWKDNARSRKVRPRG